MGAYAVSVIPPVQFPMALAMYKVPADLKSLFVMRSDLLYATVYASVLSTHLYCLHSSHDAGTLAVIASEDNNRCMETYDARLTEIASGVGNGGNSGIKEAVVKRWRETRQHSDFASGCRTYRGWGESGSIREIQPDSLTCVG